MRIRQRRLLIVVVAISLVASTLPFPGAAPQRASTPRPADQVLALPVAPAAGGDGY